MSISSVKKVVTAAKKDGVVNSAEVGRIIAEAKKGRVTTGEKKVLRDLFDKGPVTTAGKAKLAAFLGIDPKPADVNMGELLHVGQSLGGKTFQLKPGQSLVFECYGNQIQNIGGLVGAGLGIQCDVLNQIHALGEKYHYRYTVTVPQNAAAGTVFDVKSTPSYQSRNDPDYAFAFKVQVG
jgi:hypothetical protein